ncbi:hypothetical protein TNCT_598221 [Trichonephila clavata]|uniref:Uncharacterized protein n=1 Tax=Trichonephila clavata TaxID=2740835 RepID=A0A8X6JDI2_TRICU|nr:hypothetical protein TNCT_598221 [Trichonephila clavata]
MKIPDSLKMYKIVKDYVEEEFIGPGTSHDPDFQVKDLNEPQRQNQAKLRDLVRDLDLSKHKAELLASRLHQWNLLVPGIKITECRTRERIFFILRRKNMWWHVLLSTA